MAASCCTEEARCAGGASCGALESCVGACLTGDVACTSGCRARTPNGDGAEAAALQTCEATRCATACHLGGACGGYVYADPACGTCGLASCCAESTACVGNAECSALGSCERACAAGDNTCLQRCELDHPDGVAAERLLGSACRPTAPVMHPAAMGVPPASADAGATDRTGDPHHLSVRGLRDVARRARLPFARAGEPTSHAPHRLPRRPQISRHRGTPARRQRLRRVRRGQRRGLRAGPLYMPPLSKDFVTLTLGIVTNAQLQLRLASIAPSNPVFGNLVVRAYDCAACLRRASITRSTPRTARRSTSLQASLRRSPPSRTGPTPPSAGMAASSTSPAAGIKVLATVAENGLAYAPA